MRRRTRRWDRRTDGRPCSKGGSHGAARRPSAATGAGTEVARAARGRACALRGAEPRWQPLQACGAPNRAATVGGWPAREPCDGDPAPRPHPVPAPWSTTRASHDLWLASSARSQEGPPQTPAPTGGKKETARRPRNRLQTAGGGGPAAPPSRPRHMGPAPGPPGRAWSCSNPMGTRRGARSRHTTKLDLPATTQLAGGGGEPSGTPGYPEGTAGGSQPEQGGR